MEQLQIALILYHQLHVFCIIIATKP